MEQRRPEYTTGALRGWSGKIHREKRAVCHAPAAQHHHSTHVHNVCVIYSKGLWRAPAAVSLFAFHRLIVICLLMKLRSQFPFNSLLFHILCLGGRVMPSVKRRKVVAEDMILLGNQDKRRARQMVLPLPPPMPHHHQLRSQSVGNMHRKY